MRDIAYKDIKSVANLFQNYSVERISRMLNFPEARELARELLNKHYRFETEAVQALKEYYQGDTPDPEMPVCDCPLANGLRWQSSPVTWSYNAFKQPVAGSARIIRGVVRDIESVCGIQFEQNSEANANIVIRNGKIDGPGSTLGQAYQPASGDRMSACGQMCGDILIDEDEFWSEEMFRTIFMHEMLHAVGLRHNNDPRSIMFPRYLGPRSLHELDIKELLKRYPLETIT
jgi:hypothetical protein